MVIVTDTTVATGTYVWGWVRLAD